MKAPDNMTKSRAILMDLRNLTLSSTPSSTPSSTLSSTLSRAAAPESTAGLRWGLPAMAVALALIALCAPRLAHATNYPVTPEQREMADKTASAGVLLADLAPGAPASYTVKRGDTLWGIATLYLKSPWRWPELWGMNRAQIQNPHLIYPGQTLGLVKSADGRAQLVLGGAPASAQTASGATAVTVATAPAPIATTTAVPTVRLSPRAREIGNGNLPAISSVPNNQIEPFLSRPQIVAASDLDQYARIVSTQQDRVNLAVGDTAYAKGVTDPKIENYNVLRPARALYDPDDISRSHPLAYEAAFLGTARVVKPGDVTTLIITSSKLEIGVGDRLVPVARQELVSYAPHRFDKPINGRIISVYEGLDSVGAGSIVTLNRGKNEGLEIGHVLAVLRNGNDVVDHTQPGEEKIQLPDESIGTAFVFRVFDGVSYALLVAASGPIQVGDRIGPPDEIPVTNTASISPR